MNQTREKYLSGHGVSQCNHIFIYNLNTNFQFIFKLRADYLSDLQTQF